MIPPQQGAMRRFLACLGLFAFGACSLARADSTTGLINMPDARFDPDGTLRFGTSYARPYFDLTANATLLPWLETNVGVTRINGVPGFATSSNGFSQGYGAYKDKSTGLKIRLVEESSWWPSIAIGAQDIIGTRLFEKQYVAATKTLGDTQATIGYGRKQIDGVYGGIRYSPSWLRNWSASVEYDASNYKTFPFAEQTHVAGRTKGMSYGLEYRFGWFGVQVSNQRGIAGANGYVAIPLEREQWIPKFAEPEPYTKVIPRPTLAQWEQDPAYKKRMYAALFKQDFKDVRIRMEPGSRLHVTLTNSRISLMSRAVGRAARTVLLLAPLETTEIRITYTTLGLPVATYEFFDLQKLNRYFNGMLPRKELAETVAVRYAEPSSYSTKEGAELMAGLEEPTEAKILYGDGGNIVSFKSQDTGLNVFQVKPTLSTYLNGPNVFQYNISALGTYDHELAEKLFLMSGVTLTLYENISQATAVSNSTLPHVRSDFAQYSGGPRLKLDHLLLNDVYQLSERTYARLTGGYIEQMYGGFEGQWLYVAPGAPWAFDISVDAVKQRAFDGGFDFRQYQTVTALAALHYRLPYDSTLTIRTGRFLAKDYGGRFEIKRRFRSGIELGAWYTLTNAVDTGIPSESNYRDKGVFVSIPFEPMLVADTKVTTGFSLAPWTRDVGQMVKSPADLYDMLEKPLVHDMHKYDGLSQLGDMKDDYNLPYLGSPMWDNPFINMADLTFRDWGKGAGEFGLSDTWESILIGSGAVLASSLLDKKVAKLVENRNQTGAIKKEATMGKDLPLVLLGGAGLAALTEQDKRLSNTGIASIEAAGTGLLLSESLKYAVGRARPADELGSRDFDPFHRANASFPSNHVTVAWATVTPLAKEYEAPWLYGLAALVNVGRIASQQHWLSDTVAGSFIGYALGDFFWEQSRKRDDKGPRVGVSPSGVTVMWKTD
jgi:membrane-associated phospholipid phosphatase